jgi:N-acetylneuraminate lyase
MKDFLRGATTALLTPCAEDGTIDLPAIRELVDAQVAGGAVGLFVLGTAGQGPMFSVEERKTLLETIVAAADGRLTIVAHVGVLPTTVAIDLARHAVAAGADAISAVPPVYYRPDFAAARAYYEEIAAVADGRPFLAYNNPPATGFDLRPEQAIALHDAGIIAGVKQASASIPDLHALVEGGVPVWMANADLNLAALAIGAVGTISTITNVTPEPFVGLYRAMADGDLLRARALQQEIDFCASRLRGPTIGALHAGAAMRGWPAGSPRRPLRMPTEAESARIAEAVARVSAA